MKKVLLAFDGTNFSEGAFEFARKLNETEPILLTGVFLPQADYAGLWVYGDGMGVPVLSPLINDAEEDEEIAANIEKFSQRCITNGIDFRIHKSLFDFAVPQLVSETRFADLLILGSEVFYKSFEHGPSDKLKEALRKTECPVIIVPEKFDFPENIILTYDGNDSSVFAIKQFSYLFPEMCSNNAILVYMTTDESREMPEQQNIEELAARHFSNLELSTINASPKKYFTAWLRDKKNVLVVAGSYGHSGFADMFSKSFVADVITEHRLPIFIWHK